RRVARRRAGSPRWRSPSGCPCGWSRLELRLRVGDRLGPRVGLGLLLLRLERVDDDDGLVLGEFLRRGNDPALAEDLADAVEGPFLVLAARLAQQGVQLAALRGGHRLGRIADVDRFG